MHTDNVMLFYLTCVHKDFCLSLFYPYFFNLQRHTSGKVCHRFFMRPLFQNFSYTQKQHNRTCCTDISSEQRNSDGCGIQYRHFQLSPFQTLKAFFHKMQRLHRCLCSSQRCRKKQLAEIVHGKLCNKLFLINIHQFPSRVLRNQFLKLPVLKRKRCQTFDNFLPAAAVANHCMAGSFIHLCRNHIFKCAQIVLQHIRFFHGQTLLRRGKTNTTSDFMLNLYSHLASSCSFSASSFTSSASSAPSSWAHASSA